MSTAQTGAKRSNLAKPFPPCLGDKCDARGSKEDALSIFDDLLGDAKGSECLAGTARHDQSAALVVSKAGDRVLDRFSLKRPRILNEPLGVVLFDLNIEKLTEIDLSDLGMGALDRPFRQSDPTGRSPRSSAS